MLKFSCRVSNSSFSFEFVVEIFDSSFEFKFLEFSCRVLKSKFSMSCSIRLLEFRCSSRFLEFQFSIRISSSSSLNFRVELVVEFRIRVSRFVALFDFSNLTLNSSSNSTSRISCRISNSNVSSKFLVEIFVSLLYLISRISLWVCCRIQLLEFRCSIRFLEFRVFDSTSRFKRLEFDDSSFSSNFEFVLIYSTSRIVVESFVALFDFSKSHSSFEFLIELFNFRSHHLKKLNLCCYHQLTSSIILARALSLRSRCHASFARAFRA